MASRSLTDLRPEMIPLATKFLNDCASAGLSVLVTCTLRSMAEQTALYAQGRTKPGEVVTKAQAGQSAHNYGFALDVVPVVNGKLIWSTKDPVWQKVGDLGVKAGLQWYGTPGEEFVEFAHFQYRGWKLLIQQVAA